MRFWWGHTHRAASVGRKAAGSLAKAPRTAEEAAGNSGRWRPPDQSMPFAGGSGRGGHGLERGPRSGLDRAQKAEKASHSHQPHPPWPAQRAGTGPAPSRGQKLRNGEGEGSNFLAPTLTFLTSEQARLKKKKKSPHRTVQRLRSENSARSSTRHHRLLLRLRLLPRRTRSGRRQRRRRRRKQRRRRRRVPPLAPR